MLDNSPFSVFFDYSKALEQPSSYYIFVPVLLNILHLWDWKWRPIRPHRQPCRLSASKGGIIPAKRGIIPAGRRGTIPLTTGGMIAANRNFIGWFRCENCLKTKIPL